MTNKATAALVPGDRITWNDPDAGACTCTFTIRTIRSEGEFFTITKEDGTSLDAFAEELSRE